MGKYLGYIIKAGEYREGEDGQDAVRRYTYYFHPLGVLMEESASCLLQPLEGQWKNDIMLFTKWVDTEASKRMANRFLKHRLMVLQQEQWREKITDPDELGIPEQTDKCVLFDLHTEHLYPVYPLDLAAMEGDTVPLADVSLLPEERICLCTGDHYLGPFDPLQRDDGTWYVSLSLQQDDYFADALQSFSPLLAADGGLQWTVLYLPENPETAKGDLLPDAALLRRYPVSDNPDAMHQALQDCRTKALDHLQDAPNAEALAAARAQRLQNLLELPATQAMVQREKGKLRKAQTELETLQRTLRDSVEHLPEKLSEAALSSALAEAMQSRHTTRSQASEALELVQPQSMERDVLMDTLVRAVQAERPNYSRNDILNIAICLTQNLLTVFSGPPGCGKTSICKIFGKALGLEQANRFVTVAVERGWTSRRDFIGSYNPLTESFTVSNEAVYYGLKALGEEQKGDLASQLPLLILLDEANLSPMEHYWSDFMSIADDTSGKASINLGQNHVFPIPETLHFAATINNDDTTEPLSPRLVDRAWVVSLPKLSADVNPQSLLDAPGSDNAEQPDAGKQPISWQSLKVAFSERPTAKGDFSQVLEKYQQIIRKLQEMDYLISPRVARSVVRYWEVAESCFSEESGTKGDAALDFAVAQRLLPKLSGSGEAFRDQLEELREICEGANLPRSAAILQDILARGERSDLAFYSFFLY